MDKEVNDHISGGREENNLEIPSADDDNNHYEDEVFEQQHVVVDYMRTASPHEPSTIQDAMSNRPPEEELKRTQKLLGREQRRLAKLRSEANSLGSKDKTSSGLLYKLQKRLDTAIAKLADLGIDVNLAYAKEEDFTDEATSKLSTLLREKQALLAEVKPKVTSLTRELGNHDAKRPQSKISNRLKQETEKRLRMFRRKVEVEDAKNAHLNEKMTAVKEALESFKTEAKEAQEALLDKLIKNEGEREKYVHICVSELVRLLVQQRNAELPFSSSSLSSNHDRKRGGGHKRSLSGRSNEEDEGGVGQEHFHHLSRDLAKLKSKNVKLQKTYDRMTSEWMEGKKGQMEVKGLQRRFNNLLHKQLKEKDLTGLAERGTEEIEKKVSILADHVERLMLHLKHEAMDKAKAQALEGRMLREMELLRARNDTIVAKNQRRDRVIVELQEGERILEDQLCLLDEKYNELRGKLNKTRSVYRKDIKKYLDQARRVRMMWETETHGALPIEMVPLPFDDSYSPPHHRLTKSAPSHRQNGSSSIAGKRQIASEGGLKGGRLQYMPYPSTASAAPGIDPDFMNHLQSRGETSQMPEQVNVVFSSNNNEPWSDDKVRSLHQSVIEKGGEMHREETGS